MSYIISYVGAGGKTSSIYQDAAAFVNEGKKVMITTTTHMYVPKDRVFIDGREKSCEKLREEVAGILKKNGICVCGTILSDNKKTEIYAVGKCAGNDAVEEQQKMEPEKFKTLSIKQLTAVCKEADVVLGNQAGVHRQVPFVFPSSPITYTFHCGGTPFHSNAPAKPPDPGSPARGPPASRFFPPNWPAPPGPSSVSTPSPAPASVPGAPGPGPGTPRTSPAMS